MRATYCPRCRRAFTALTTCPADRTLLLPMPLGYPSANTVIDGAFGLLGAMAAGGMSRIFRAHSLRDALPVAVKVLEPARAFYPYAVERFLREARVSLLLDHRNVVDVYSFGLTAEGHWVIVMELLGGENLLSVIRRLGRLPWQRAVHIAIEVSEALGHAHGRRVVHRDLKPENIMLMGDPGPNERVKLLDFGIAYVAADSAFSGPAPGSTGVSGTPAYMSPEQIRAQALDGRSDLYAMGILLFEMLTGRRPFLGDDPVAVCRHHLLDRPPQVEDLVPDGDVPRELAQLVRRLLAKAPSRREPGVGALLEQLRRLQPAADVRRGRRRPSARSHGLRPRASATLHGLPDVSPRRGRGEFHVAMLHVEIEEDQGDDVYPGEPPPAVTDLLMRWAGVVEEAHGTIQQPEPRALRVFYGLFEAGLIGRDEPATAARHALLLAALTSRADRDHGISMKLRAGLVVRTFDPRRSQAPAMLLDADADLAYLLARRAAPGTVLTDSHTAFVLRPSARLEPVDSVVGPGLSAPVPAWRLSEMLHS